MVLEGFLNLLLLVNKKAPQFLKSFCAGEGSRTPTPCGTRS